MPEQELIQKCLKGDGTSFGRLISPYRPKLFGYLSRFTDCRDEAEELFQDTLIKAWKGLQKYNDKNKFSSWLFTIAHHTAVDYARKKKVINETIMIENPGIKSLSREPEEEYIENETFELIKKALVTLTDKQKNVFLLRQHSGMTFKEIAQLTNEPLNTVISHMSYSVKKIKTFLREKNEFPKKLFNG